MKIDAADFDELEAWIDSFDPRPSSNAERLTFDTLADFATSVDLAAGEFFRTNWRKRLSDAHGDCGYVARQMRKAGVPLDLALAILLAPDARLSWLQASVGLIGAGGDEQRPADAGQLALARVARPQALQAA
jgi:hypothetical protein